MSKKNTITERLKKDLPVQFIRKEYRAWFYVVEYGGNDYYVKMFDFQKNDDNKPNTIRCLIEKTAGGQTDVKQDLVPLIAARYKVGGTYKFRLKRNDQRNGQYDAISPENFKFYLDNPKDKYYPDHTEILGRVKSVDDVKVMVEEAEATRDEAGNFSKFIAPETLFELAERLGTRPSIVKWAIRVFDAHLDFADARTLLEARAPGWLSETIAVIRDQMPHWVRRVGKISHQREVLRELRRIGIEILEQSNIATGDTQDAERLRRNVSSCINAADEYNSALAKIDEGTIEQYAEGTMSSLSRTGYIYEPLHRLHVMTCAMATDRGLMAEWMPTMFSTLTSRGTADWRQEPLRHALLDMLTTYIDINSHRADKVIDIKLGDNKVIVTDIMRAMTMTLLLTTEEDRINRRMLMSRLCRYASLYGTTPATSQSLNDKAYGFLLTNAPQVLPFSWNDLKYSADIISVKTGAAALLTGPVETVQYEGERASVSVIGGDITITQIGGVGRLREVLPAGLPGWRNFHILTTNKNLTAPAKADTDDITELRRMWRDIEDTLFDPKKENGAAAATTVRKAKIHAEEGDEVFIRITGRDGRRDDNGNPLFHAVIVNDSIKGEGSISPRDIVHYNVKAAQTTDFQTPDGRQLLLRAYVDYVCDDDTCVFTMASLVDGFVSEYAQEGDEVLCRMTITMANGDSLLISEKGYSLKVPRDYDTPQLRNGEMAMVEIQRVYPDGKVDGVITSTVEYGHEITDSDCLCAIMQAYAEGVYEDDDDDEDEEEDDMGYDMQNSGEMDRSELTELMSIIDRQSNLTTNRAQAFNLLAVARLMALTMGDKRKADEYHDRMIFIHLMQQYAVNQWIDTEEFERHYISSRDIMSDYPDMQDQIMRLFCISRMDKENSDLDLARVMAERRGTLTADIASLVLAYNVLKHHELDSERRGIRNKINELLGVETRDVSHLDFMGEEGPCLEFKTSLVFPPDSNLRPDKAKQCTKLLTVVCGMMNYQGGRLLVGVNDTGMAVGVDADFKELSGSSIYDEQKARDIMNNFFISMMRQHMPGEASLYVRTSFEDHNGRSIFAVEVDSAKRVMDVDGMYYRRVGATTRVMDENERIAVEDLKKGK